MKFTVLELGLGGHLAEEAQYFAQLLGGHDAVTVGVECGEGVLEFAYLLLA